MGRVEPSKKEAREPARLMQLQYPRRIRSGLSCNLQLLGVGCRPPDHRTRTDPATTGRNFDEILRVLDSLQMTHYYEVATPANWREGEDCYVLPSVPAAALSGKFPNGVKVVVVPSKKPYLKATPVPTHEVDKSADYWRPCVVGARGAARAAKQPSERCPCAVKTSGVWLMRAQWPCMAFRRGLPTRYCTRTKRACTADRASPRVARRGAQQRDPVRRSREHRVARSQRSRDGRLVGEVCVYIGS